MSAEMQDVEILFLSCEMVIVYISKFQVLLKKEELICNKLYAKSYKSSKCRFTIVA